MPNKSCSPSAAPASAARSLPVVQPNAAGLDIGAEWIYAALPPDRAPEPVRRFGTFTADLRELAAWLVAHGSTTVALEATGVFWIPVFQILEQAGLEVCLVNARHVKNVRGRKTDVVDCQWLQQLHAAGLLHASFRPPDVICAIRSILRYRESLVTQGATQIQHMQKALTQMNLQLHHVLSDITGVSGLRIIDAILAGEREPLKLAALRDKKVKATSETIAAALVGDWRPEHLFVLRQARGHYAYFQAQLAECDREVERWLATLDSQADPDDVPPPPATAQQRKPRKNEFRLPAADLRTELFRILGTDVTRTPGLGPATVVKVLAEVGPDLSAFPTRKRFCSWLAGCPDPSRRGAGRCGTERGGSSIG